VISTRDLSELPVVDDLRRLMQSLAMLDAILCREWEYRYFSFNSRWAVGEQMGSMRDGQGDHYFAMFNAAGCWLKGFAHEAPMSPFRNDPARVAAGILEGVPTEFSACLSEPAFVIDETTFCIWRCYGDREWRHGPVTFSEDDEDPDGSAALLRWLDGRAETYRKWAEEYYEREVALSAVRAVYAHQPLNQGLVGQLNDAILMEELREDISEIGYPLP
jgi:hypothetical protein